MLAAEANAHRSTEPPKIAAEEAESEEEAPQPLTKSADVRPITPDAPEAIIQTRKDEAAAATATAALLSKPVEPIVEAPQPVGKLFFLMSRFSCAYFKGLFLYIFIGIADLVEDR